jgi:hypothetical protein
MKFGLYAWEPDGSVDRILKVRRRECYSPACSVGLQCTAPQPPRR